MFFDSRGIIVKFFIPIALIFTVWLSSSPIGSSPDDDYHLASIWCAPGHVTNLCKETNSAQTREISTQFKELICFAHKPDLGGVCQQNLSSNPGILVESKRGNFNSKYPNIYYQTASFFVDDNIISSALRIRILNLGLFLLITLIFLIKLPLQLKTSYTRVVLLSSVPLGLFFIPSTNPSSWTFTGIFAIFFAFSAYLSEERNRGNKILFLTLTAIGVILAVGSRADGSLFGLVAILSSFFIYRKISKRNLVLVVTGFFVIFLGLFFFLSYNPSIFAPKSYSEKSFVSVLIHNLTNLPDVWLGLFGSYGLGWLDTPMPSTVSVLMIIVIFAVYFSLLPKFSTKQHVILFILFAGLAMVPLVHLQLRSATVGESFQSRYIFPLLIIFLSVIFSSLDTKRLYSSKVQTFIVWVVLSVAQSIALLTELIRYVDPLGGVLSLIYITDSAWWWDTPISPVVVWFIGTLAFSFLAANVLASKSLNKNSDVHSGNFSLK